MPEALQIGVKLCLLAYLVWAVSAAYRRHRAGVREAPPRWQLVLHGVAVVVAMGSYGRFDRFVRTSYATRTTRSTTTSARSRRG